jgi:hypothetical protein
MGGLAVGDGEDLNRDSLSERHLEESAGTQDLIVGVRSDQDDSTNMQFAERCEVV